MMHEVKCEQCGRVLGIITDEKWGGKRIYKAVETVVFGVPGAFIDGEQQTSRGTYCTDHSPRRSKPKAKQTIPLRGVLPKFSKFKTQSSTLDV